MNIWILNHYAGPPASGRADRAAHVARELTKAGHTCTVFHAAFHHLLMEPQEIATPNYQTHDEADFIAIPTRPYEGNGIARLRNMFEFPRKVLSESADVIANSGAPDVVIVSSPPPMSIRAARRIRRRHGSKVVFEVRDPWPDSLIEIAGAPRWHPFVVLVRMLVRSAYRHADAVVVTTSGLTAHVSQNGGPDVVTHSITNGVDVAQFDEAMGNPVPQPHDGEIERLQQLGKTVVVYAGSMGPPNALEQLLAIDPPEDPPFHLVLVGDGVSKASLESAAHERDLGWVTFLPKVAKDQVPPLLSRADATIIAWHDSPIYRWGVSPNKISEYMLAARPVIWVGNVPDDPVSISGAGLTVQPDDPAGLLAALMELASMPSEGRLEIGSRGRQYALENLDWARLGEDYAAFIAELT